MHIPVFLLCNHRLSLLISAQVIEPITETLADVQTPLLTLITPSGILPSHSLKSDLCVVPLSRPRCIDTAIILHPCGRLLKLGWHGSRVQLAHRAVGLADKISKSMYGGLSGLTENKDKKCCASFTHSAIFRPMIGNIASLGPIELILRVSRACHYTVFLVAMHER